MTRGRLRGSDLQQPFRGVRSASSAELTAAELCRALQAKLPDYAYFSGVTAAKLFGVPLPWRLQIQSTVHVGVPAPHRAPVGCGIQGHQYQVHPTDLRGLHGIRVSSPARLWCELAATLGVADLVAAGDYIIHWQYPLASSTELWNTLTHFPGRRGLRALHEAHRLLHDRSESAKESHLRVIVVQGGIPGIEVNLPITTRDGYNYRADLAIPSRKVIIEYQSDFHRDPEWFRRDMTRTSRLEADGWYVMQVNARDLENPAELLRRLNRILAMRPSP